MARRLAPGDVLLARFPEPRPSGHEQHGLRPALVVGLPDLLGQPRFPVVLLTPLTTDRRQAWASRSPRLYPRLPAGAGGLPADSLALLDQTRSLDWERVAGYLGTLPSEVYQPVRDGLHDMLGSRRRGSEPAE